MELKTTAEIVANKIERNPNMIPAIVHPLGRSWQQPKRKDITVIPIEANAIAEELGQGRVANMVMLGTMIKKTGLLSLETLKNAQRKRFTKVNKEQLILNDKALEKGYGLL